MNWKTIDATLQQMSEQRNILLLQKAKCDKAKQRAERTFAESTHGPRELLKRLETKLEGLCEKSKEEIGTSQKRTAGEVGFKKPGPTVELTKPEKEVVKKIIDANADVLVNFGAPKVSRTAVKDQFSLKTFTAKQLARFGIVITNEPKFFFKLNTTKPS